MKNIILLVALLLPCMANANEWVDTKVGGYRVKAIKVTRYTGYKVIVGVSGEGESLESLVKRYGGVSGMNGAYFCPAEYKKQCPSGNKTYADRISNGVDYSASPDDTGPERAVFALDRAQSPFLYRRAHDYSRGRDDEFQIGKNINFERKRDIFNGIGNHPLLLQGGISKIKESKAIDEKMKSKGLKNFICSTEDGNTIYMGGIEDISIYQVPEVLEGLGCFDAVNMDSGGSTALIYNNKYKRGPGRKIMDAWIVIPDKNYPVRSEYSKNAKVMKLIEEFKAILIDRLAFLDDLSRKQKLFALSSKLGELIDMSPKGSFKRELYEGMKRYVDSLIM